MSSKLYVGNLPFETTRDQLMELFGQAGTVTDATIITDRMSGRSKGFGFVEMSSEEEAKKTIEMFNNTDFNGRSLKVDLARPPRENSFRRGR